VTDVVVLDEHHAVERRPGGYAGWDAERRRRPTAAKTPPMRQAVPDRPVAERTGPSPSTLRHQLRKVERDLERAQRRRDELLAALAGAGDDHRAHADLGTQLAAAEAELGTAEERWLELSVEAG
jgi:hypothetical protein